VNSINGTHSPVNSSEFTERLRRFEYSLQARMAELPCPVHLCLGQEAVPDALNECLRPEDWLFSTHRNHGHYLAKGGSEQKLLDEIMGLESGVNQGFAGSQCFSDPSINFHSTAMVGGLIGVAVGTALALKLAGSPAISVCCIGDGATEQGVFWESLNFAALHSLPILFVCEDNGYSVHAPLADRQHGDLCAKVGAFDVAVFYGIDNAAEYVRLGSPAFVYVPCERECNHVGNMPDFRHGDKA